MTTLDRRTIGLLCGLAAAVTWAGGAVVSRYLVTTRFSAIDLTLLRYLGCFPIALLAVIFDRQRSMPDISWGRLAVLIALAGPPYHALIIAGYNHATAGAGTLLVTGMLPFYTLGLALLLTRTWPAQRQLVGAGLAVAGLAVFALSRLGQIVIDEIGLMIFGGSALLWALLNHYIRAWNIDPWRLTVALALWSPLFLPLYLVWMPGDISHLVSWDGFLQLAYHGWVVAFASTLLFFIAVHRIDPTVIAILPTLSPILSALLGTILLGEPFGWPHFVGMILIFIGVILASTRARAMNPVAGVPAATTGRP